MAMQSGDAVRVDILRLKRRMGLMVEGRRERSVSGISIEVGVETASVVRVECCGGRCG